MEEKKLEQFRKSLLSHHRALYQFVNSDSGKNRHMLGGKTTNDVLEIVSKLKSVLDNIDSGDFGRCDQCDGQVEIDRLELDCTTSVCLDHYSSSQIRALEYDLELAAKVQKQLLPCCVPSLSDVQFAFHSEPFQVVGGDYYDFFNHHNDGQGFVVADVMGKGLAASMLMSNLQASLRILGPESHTLDALINRLNDLFCYNVRLIRFISIFLATLHPETKILKYCNAGHHPALLWKENKKTVLELNPTGPAIGLMHKPQYDSITLALDSGDFLLMYTDGLIEARNVNNEEFTEERLANYMKENHNKSAEDFLTDLLNKTREYAKIFQDDVTVVAVKLL